MPPRVEVRQRLHHRVAGAELLRPGRAQATSGVGDALRAPASPPWPITTHRRCGREQRARSRSRARAGAAGERVQDLGQVGAHALALARGEDDDLERVRTTSSGSLWTATKRAGVEPCPMCCASVKEFLIPLMRESTPSAALAQLADRGDLRDASRARPGPWRSPSCRCGCERFLRRRFASSAFASSRSWPRIAVSASTVTPSGCTSSMPPGDEDQLFLAAARGLDADWCPA